MAFHYPFRRLSTLALAGLFTLLAPSTGVAAPANGVHVLELASDFDYRAQAQALTSLLRLRLSDGGFVVASENPSLVQATSKLRACDLKGFDPSVLRDEADRGIDVRCERAVAARLGAKRVLWGHLYTASDGKLWAKVHLWQEDGAERVKALPYEATTRERVADRLYLHLARPDEAADVKVTAPSAASEGELFVDGKSQGPFRPGLELTVKAGEHALEVRREGKAVAEAKVTAVAGKANEAQLAAVFLPRTDIPIEFPDPPPKVVAPQPSTWQRPAGFVGLGLGAALLGAGVFSSLRVKGLENDFEAADVFAYRSSVGSGRNACDEADAGFTSARADAASPGKVSDLCSSISRYETLQYVFYGLGAVSAGVGAYLLLSAPSQKAAAQANAPRAGWQVQPLVSGSTTGLTLRGNFF